MKPCLTPDQEHERLRRINEKLKAEAEAVRRRAADHPDSEPSGKLTSPCELDLKRDRKNDDG